MLEEDPLLLLRELLQVIVKRSVHPAWSGVEIVLGDTVEIRCCRQEAQPNGADDGLLPCVVLAQENGYTERQLQFELSPASSGDLRALKTRKFSADSVATYIAPPPKDRHHGRGRHIPRTTLPGCARLFGKANY